MEGVLQSLNRIFIVVLTLFILTITLPLPSIHAQACENGWGELDIGIDIGSAEGIWGDVTSGLNDVWGISSSDVFAVGSAGTIIHYDGSVWSQMNSGTTSSLVDVWGSSANDVYAVGVSDGIVLHYDGESWTTIGGGTSYSRWRWGVWGSSSSDVFVVGQEGIIEHYDGSTWTFMDNPDSHWLYAIWGISSSDVFAAGDHGTVLHYDGSTWTNMNHPDSPDDEQIMDIWGSSPSDLFTVTVYGAIFHYDGSTWTLMNRGLAHQLWSIWGSSSADVYAGGDRGSILHYPTVCHSLTIDAIGHGEIGVAPPQPSGGYTTGTEVTLTADANEGYEFDHWSGTNDNDANPTTVTMNTDKSVTAYFTETEPTTSLGEAVDNVALTWTTGGSAEWFGQTTTYHYDGDAARSVDVTHNQASWLRATVSGPGTLTFYWKVSSESGYDSLEFYIGGEEQTSISGSVDWQQKTYSITSGTHALEWRYTKDGSQDSGSDCGWLDKVEFTSTPTPTPVIELVPNSGIPGEEVTIRGHNFAADAWVDIYYYLNGSRIWIDDVRTDGDGDFPWVTFTVPESYTGPHEVFAEDEDAIDAYADFTVEPGLIVYPEEGPVGTTVTVEGLGFAEDERNIQLMYYPDSDYGALVAGDITADEDGSWEASFVIPASAHGYHEIDAQGAENGLYDVENTIFIVLPSTPTPTPAPNLISPANGAKVQGPINLDWESVHSADTYILQVATEPYFLPRYILLEKTGLIKSEYTITERDLALMEGLDASIYWRVKSVDDAQNESPWSEAREMKLQTASSNKWLWFLILIPVIGLGVWLVSRKRAAVEVVPVPSTQAVPSKPFVSEPVSPAQKAPVQERPEPRPEAGIKPKPAISAFETSTSSKAASAVCSKCGGANRPNASFCAHCGASLEIARTCNKCGFLNRLGAAFCGRCGKSLKDVP